MFLAPGLPALEKKLTLLRRYFSLNSPVLFGVWFGEIRCAGSHCAFPTNRTMVRILCETYQRGAVFSNGCSPNRFRMRRKLESSPQRTQGSTEGPFVRLEDSSGRG